MKKITYIILVFSLLAGLLFPVYGSGTSGSISNKYLYDYAQPPTFQPSLNSQFCALADSATSVLNNPAGIMKVNTFEAAIGVSGAVSNPIRINQDNYFLNDQSMSPGDLPGSMIADIAVRATADRTASTPEARAIALEDAYSKGGGINYFGLTFKVSDSLGVAFSRQRPTAISVNVDATLPEMNDVNLDMRGFEQLNDTNDGIRIRNDGYIEVLSGGTVIGTSEGAVYERFLNQSTDEVNWITMRMNNSIVNEQSVIITTAFKTGPVNWGVNIIPMTYNINMDNEISVKSDENNGNVGFLYPRLSEDFTTLEALNWVTYESTVASGYISKEVAMHPTGTYELAAMEVAGQYSGSALRLDLGAMWEPTDFFSMGFMYENFNGAKMVLSGKNVVHYAQHWIDTGSTMPTVEGEVWYPYLGTPTHEEQAEKYIELSDTLTPIVIPSKLKVGFAFKKPIMIAVDWEQWVSEVAINTNPGSPEGAKIADISGLTFIKVGSETQLFFLPVLVRGSLNMLLKPSSNDPDIQQSFDDLFAQVPVLPIEGDIYFSGKVYNGELGFGFGGGGMPLAMALCADMTKIAKIFFADVYYAEDFWKVDFQMTTDPVLTGFDTDLSEETIGMEDIRLATTSTLSVGFKF